jgi:branched-subunit amino acid transport protein
MHFTPGNLFASLFISSIGAALFIYGKKQERIPQLTAGIVLSIFPMLVASVAWMIVIAIAILAGLPFLVRAGY